MRKIVFDIETANQFSDVESSNPRDLEISVVGAYDSATDMFATYLVDELPSLWKLIEESDALIGYNSDHFDIPLLDKYYPGDLTRIKSIDLMKEIKNVLGRRLKLDSVAEATLGKNKTGAGLDAITWWRNGEIDKVRKYCIEDVRITKELYDYAVKHGALKYKDFGTSKEVALDTSRWEELADASSMTHTLPF